MDSTGAAPSVTARAFVPPTTKRSDSGVALGLFSKIAAARKEKLSPFQAGTAASTASAKTEAPQERRAVSLPIGRTSQFPEIHDPSARSVHTASAASHSHSARKSESSRRLGYAQRWNKLEDTRGRSISPVTTPAFPIARGSHTRAATPERTRRSLYEVGKSSAFGTERIQPLEDLGARPFTAGDESTFGQDSGYVRRPIEGSINNFALLSQRRTSEWMQPPKPSTADIGFRRVSSPVVLRAQSEVFLLDSPTKTPAAEPALKDVSEQEIYFADATDVSGVPVVYRNQKAKATNPERLNLDRRNLLVLPRLEGEQMLRLLNLQNNGIRKIDNLLNLPNLIFLDLYNNRIERLENLHVLPNLRVLMLGKNRLQRIENLDTLKKLDVLDLHSNDLERIENLDELTELRVLNLGGNRIKTLMGIDKLHLLTELNLRRNSISSISPSIGRLPSLQRLFLSSNKLETLTALEPLFLVPSIVELRLDNNAVCEGNHVEYRSRMIKSFPLLKHLDVHPLSDAERKEGVLFYSQAQAASKKRDDLEATQRTQAIAHIRSLWDKHERRPKSEHVSGSGNRWGRPRGIPSSTVSESTTPSTDPFEDGQPLPTSREDGTVHNTNTGYSEIEVYDEHRVLSIYGEALGVLDSAKIHASVHAIHFQFVAIDRIQAVAASATSANLKLFARLRRVRFAHNEIESFAQLTWLATMGSRCEELLVTHNAVCSRALFQHFVAFRISNVARLNGQEITAAERSMGRQLFQKISPPWQSAETSSITTKPKDTKQYSAPRVSTASMIANDIVVSATEMEKKNALVDDAWRAVLTAITKETLKEIAHHEGDYMAGCLDGL